MSHRISFSRGASCWQKWQAQVFDERIAAGRILSELCHVVGVAELCSRSVLICSSSCAALQCSHSSLVLRRWAASEARDHRGPDPGGGEGGRRSGYEEEVAEEKDKEERASDEESTIVCD